MKTFLLFALFVFPLYGNTVEQSNGWISQKSVGKALICGVCRDVAESFSFTKKNIETIGSLFDDYQVLIYENNSEDRTPELLLEWTKENRRISFKTEVLTQEDLAKDCFNITAQNRYFRSEIIARARNIVLDRAMESSFDDYEYIIWLDLDFHHLLNVHAIKDVLKAKDKWDAIFGYGIDPQGGYFDWYAFRDKTLPLGAEIYGNDWWVYPKKLNLHHTSNWHPVYSAFGGFGIYKREALKGCRYSGLVTKDLEGLAKEILTGIRPSDKEFLDAFMKEKEKIEKVHLLPHPSDSAGWYPLNEGIQISENGLIFRMNSGVAVYPSVCEHVPLHASMIMHGYDRLFIAPKIVLEYEAR